MTKEDKDLLLKDLCARLPYEINIQVKDWTTLDTELKIGHIQRLQNDNLELKPYLRPLSSMTEEEKKERNKFVKSMVDSKGYTHYIVFPHDSTYYTDWLNANHFDYHGLIELGLALEAPDGMYDCKV